MRRVPEEPPALRIEGHQLAVSPRIKHHVFHQHQGGSELSGNGQLAHAHLFRRPPLLAGVAVQADDPLAVEKRCVPGIHGQGGGSGRHFALPEHLARSLVDGQQVAFLAVPGALVNGPVIDPPANGFFPLEIRRGKRIGIGQHEQHAV